MTISNGPSARKAKSLQYLEEHQVPVLEDLPELPSEEEIRLPKLETLVNRCLVLCFLGLKSEGLEASRLDRFAEKYQVKDFLSPAERKFVQAKKPREQDIINANWRYEGMHVLLWVLGYVDELDFPDKICPVNEDLKIIAPRTKENLLQEANLRSSNQILEMADLHFRLHAVCVEAQDKKQRPPAKLNPSVVYERHYTGSWLIGGEDWDEIREDHHE